MRYVWLALLPLLACAGVRQWDNPGWESPVEIVIESSSDAQSWSVAGCQPDGQALSLSVPDANYYRARAIERGPAAASDCDTDNAAAISPYSNVYSELAGLLPYSSVDISPVLPWAIPDEPEPPMAVGYDHISALHETSGASAGGNLGASVASGDIIVALITNWNSAPSAVTDSLGNAYEPQAVADNGADRAAIWTADVTNAGTPVVTVTVQGDDSSSVQLFKITGGDYDSIVGGTGSGNSNTAVANLSDTTVDDSAVIGVMHRNLTIRTITAGTGWTQAGEQENNDTAMAFSAIYRIAGAAGAYDPTWNMSGNAVWIAAGIIIPPATGGGSVSIAAEQGSYALTGQAAGLLRGSKLAANQGSYTLTGQAAGLSRDIQITAEQGSYTLTGQAAGLLRGLLVAAEQGSYTLTGQAAGLLRGLLLQAGQGSYTLTGQDAGLLRALLLQAETGSYTLTGQAANLLTASALTAETGSYTLTGQAAGLLRGLLLQAAQGAYTLTGQSAALLRGPQITAEQGSYTLTGQDVGLLRALKLAAETGSYTLTGQAAGLLSSSQLAAEMGSYALTGQDIGLLRGLRLIAEQGSYALTGQAATLIAGQRLTAEAGVYVLTGQNAGLLRGLLLQAETGSYAATGQDAGLLRALLLQAEQGSYTLTGQDVSLLRSLRLAAEQGSYVLTGQDAGLRRWLLLAESGVYTLTGQAVALDVGSTSAGELAATITIQPVLSAIPDIMPAVTGRIALH